MFVFVVWHKTLYVSGRNRRQWREPRKVWLAQSKKQQACLSKLEALKWDNESKDYVIYRLNVKQPTQGKLAEIAKALHDCGWKDPKTRELIPGFSGPYWGQGQIAWQGIGAGDQKRVNAKLARQTADDYLKRNLDLLAQIRTLAGYSSQFEAWGLPDVTEEMRERWTALQTAEIDRWTEYLADKDSTVSSKVHALLGTGSDDMFEETLSSAYHLASKVVATKSQQVATVSEIAREYGMTQKKLLEKVRINTNKPGKKSETQKQSFEQAIADVNPLAIQTQGNGKLDSSVEMPTDQVEIEQLMLTSSGLRVVGGSEILW